MLRLTRLLLDEGSSVHDVLQNFARSLKTFVQSCEYLEQRRLHSLLKERRGLLWKSKENVRPNHALDYSLMLTSSQVRSVAQLVLYDPSQRIINADMQEGTASEIGLELVSELVRQSEIDFRTLKEHIRVLLSIQTQASIRQLLESFPAEQGLGSVVGYVALGAKHGEITGDRNGVLGGRRRGHSSARVPAIYFLRERYSEFTD